jgi:pullulanase/glycogen debranching enzyme
MDANAPDPLWYKKAVIYELHVRAFYDSNADGIGDLKGVVERLPYLQDLGVTCLWLLPFYPSPLRDDGYDIADYYGIHPDYGTLADFELLVEEAHKRGMRVLTELDLVEVEGDADAPRLRLLGNPGRTELERSPAYVAYLARLAAAEAALGADAARRAA